MKKGYLLVAAALLFGGCSAEEFGRKIAEANKRAAQERMQQLQQQREMEENGHRVVDVELICNLESEDFDAQAYCGNSKKGVGFYTTYRKILRDYKILHKASARHPDGSPNYLLPNGKVALTRLWIIKKDGS